MKISITLNKYILSGILLTLLVLTGCGQQETPGVIYGKVTLIGSEHYNGTTVSGAGMEIETDDHGNFVIMDIPVGTWPLIAKKPGFFHKIKTITVQSSDVVVDVEFELVKISPPDLPKSKY